MFIRFHEWRRSYRPARQPEAPVKREKQPLVHPEYEYDTFDAWERLYLFLYREISIACEWLGIYDGSTKTFYARRVFYYSAALVFGLGILLPLVGAALLYMMRCM